MYAIFFEWIFFEKGFLARMPLGLLLFLILYPIFFPYVGEAS